MIYRKKLYHRMLNKIRHLHIYDKIAQFNNTKFV